MASSFRSDDAILSGSLTHLSNGDSYLVAGAGIAITTGSNGSVTITNDGTVGDITSVVAGTGLSGGGTSADVTLNIDLSELTDMTQTVDSSEDELIILDNGEDRRKLISEIPLSAFNNDSSFIAGVTVQDEGGALSTAGTTINFTGAGVTATGTGATKTVTIPAGGAVSAVANGSDNRVATFSSADALNGEANLTFDGSDLTITGSILIKGDMSINQGNFLIFSDPGDSNTPHQSIVGGTDSLTIEADNILNVNSDTLVNIKANQTTLSLRSEKTHINSTFQDSDFLVSGNGESNQGLIYVDGADHSILIGGQNLGFLETGGDKTPADQAVALGYGNDVKILLSGSIGTKDTSTRGVTLVTSDLVVSGNLYHGASGNSIIRSTERGRIRNLTEADLNTGVFLIEDEIIGADVGLTGTTFRSTYVCHSSGSFEQISFRFTSAATIESQGGLTASFHLGKDGFNVNNLGASPSFLEEVFINAADIAQDRNLHFIFSGSDFEPGDAYAVRIKSDVDGGTAVKLFGGYTFVISHFI